MPGQKKKKDCTRKINTEGLMNSKKPRTRKKKQKTKDNEHTRSIGERNQYYFIQKSLIKKISD